jgi:ribonuclease BN (tRNA processing enzyme)
MAGLSFITLGVGDAFSARFYSSSIAVEAEGRMLLVDCPHPIRKILREAGDAVGERLDVDRFEAVALTHLHADHASGVEGFGYFCHFVVGHRARIAAHPAVVERLWNGHLAAGMEQLIDLPGEPPAPHRFEEFFEHLPLDERAPVQVGPFSIECRRTIHHIPTTALRIRAGGRCLGYSADTAFDPSLIAWLGEADLVVHETNYGAHTPYAKLAALPADMRARMRLIHYPDEFPVEETAIEPLRQARRYAV